jgi:hypothetical protein
MGKKKNSLTLPLVIGGGALAIWYFFFRNPAAAAITPAGSTPLSTGVNASPGTVIYSTAPTPSANVTLDAVIQGWFNTLDAANKQRAYATYGNWTDAEKTEMGDIIVNVWGTGSKPSADQVIFWNALRVKYHILDGTYA